MSRRGGGARWAARWGVATGVARSGWCLFFGRWCGWTTAAGRAARLVATGGVTHVRGVGGVADADVRTLAAAVRVPPSSCWLLYGRWPWDIPTCLFPCVLPLSLPGSTRHYATPTGRSPLRHSSPPLCYSFLPSWPLPVLLSPPHPLSPPPPRSVLPRRPRRSVGPAAAGADPDRRGQVLCQVHYQAGHVTHGGGERVPRQVHGPLPRGPHARRQGIGEPTVTRGVRACLPACRTVRLPFCLSALFGLLFALCSSASIP